MKKNLEKSSSKNHVLFMNVFSCMTSRASSFSYFLFPYFMWFKQPFTISLVHV